jgi:hypothetical protein
MTEISNGWATRRAHRGAVLLDQRDPGWARRIDLAALDMHHFRLCVAGQLARPHPGRPPSAAWDDVWDDVWYVRDFLGLRLAAAQVDHGFTVSVARAGDDLAWQLLGLAWTSEVTARVDDVVLQHMLPMSATEPLRMADTLTIALRVKGAVLASDPAAALLELTAPLGRRLLAYMDQVRDLQTQSEVPLEEVRSVDRGGSHLTWLVDVAPPLDQNELLRHDWALLQGDRLASILAAIEAAPELPAKVDAATLVVGPDRISWRSYAKHSDDDEPFITPDLRRDTLADLLAQLG